MERHSGLPIARRAVLTGAERLAMTSAVLARTTGSPCHRALALAGSRPDGPLDGPTSALLAGHLEHCDRCRAVVDTLAELPSVLPSLSQIDPGAEFTTRVVAATSARKTVSRWPLWDRVKPKWEWSGAFGQRAAAAWQRVVARPRLSLELAYLATVLLVILSGNPGLIADAISIRPHAVTAGQPASVSAGTRQPGDSAQLARPAVPTFVERTLRQIESRQTGAAKAWNGFVERTAQWLAASWDWFQRLFGWIEQAPAPSAPTEPAKASVRATEKRTYS